MSWGRTPERLNPASDAQKQALLFGGGKNRNIKTNDPMPEERVFKVENIEGIVEEGRKSPSAIVIWWCVDLD